MFSPHPGDQSGGTTPGIAVIIPSYNSAAFLTETISSVLAQTCPVELIVIDDGSPGKDAEIAAGFGARVTLIRQKNMGMSGARQRGLEAAQAEMVMFLDADDALLPNALELLSTALRANPDAVLAAGAAELWTPDAAVTSRPDTALGWPREKTFWQDLLSGNCIRTPGCALIRRPALIAAGGWDKDIRLQGSEDWNLWLRLAEQGAFARVTTPVLKYRQHAGSYSTSHQRKMFRSAYLNLAKQRTRWPHDSARLAAIADAEWNLTTNVARNTLRYARNEIGRKHFGEAISALAEAVYLGARPLAVRILTMPGRHWRRAGARGI
jgi:glycosyltransferase involved in cell wall biosynthesis